jgi:two-component system NtrC family sensor kinase
MDQKQYEKRTKQQLIKALADKKRRIAELEAATNDCISSKEEALRSYQTQEVLNKLLHIALQNFSLEAMLRQFIDEITSLSWLVLESRGAIFLTGRDPNVLEMKAYRALEPSLLKRCKKVHFGECLCGRAALSGEIQFAGCLDKRHEVIYDGMSPHGHYCVPIITGNNMVIGVITLYLREGHCRNRREEDFLIAVANTVAGVVEQKEAEKKLKKKEIELKALFKNIPTGVFVSSKEGKFLNANQALLDMLGYESREEFLDIDITRDLYVRPEDRDTFREMIERDGHVIDYEVNFKRKDGSTIPILLTGHARYDQQGNVIGYEGINVDLTRRKLMEKELQEAYDFINQIIQSSPNSIMATDLAGDILIWNRAAEETLGYSSNEVIGKMNIRKIYPEGTARKVMQMLRSSEYGCAGRLRSYPMVYVRRDGEVVEGTLSAAIVYDAKGNEIASVGSFVDLRERLEMERALRKTQEQLLQSEKLAAMGRLTSQVAHEVNNPLYGIMNTLELLKTEISPESKRRKILEMAHSETIRLSDMLRKMLSFSKPDQEERQPVEINSVLDEILLLHEKQLRELDIKIASKFAEGLGLVNASKNQLRQVLLNMVANARDAMPGGGTLTVTTSGDAEKINVIIADTGIGIPEKNLSKIFDSFFTTKDEIKGVGLGLSVCYGFIKDHGGDIHVTSQVDAGTTFTITLPIHPISKSTSAK